MLQRIIFWTLGSPDTLLRGIHDAGFQPTASSAAIPERRGWAVRWPAIVLAVLGWNSLYLLDVGPGQKSVAGAGVALRRRSSSDALRGGRSAQTSEVPEDGSQNPVGTLVRFLAFSAPPGIYSEQPDRSFSLSLPGLWRVCSSRRQAQSEGKSAFAFLGFYATDWRRDIYRNPDGFDAKQIGCSDPPGAAEPAAFAAHGRFLVRRTFCR